MSDSSLHTTTMHALLDAMREGNAAASDELFRRIEHRLGRLCRKMLGRFPAVRGKEQTGDVLQNSLLRLMRSLRELRPANTREFFGLASEQIRRELHDLVRYLQAACRAAAALASLQGAADSSADGVNPPAPADNPDDLDRWSAFHETVSGLPAEEKEVVGLIFYHGLKQKEVADLLQVSERQVRRYWVSACCKLKEILQVEMPRV
ncbi:MAG: sigma-70 family RNA polymerase sigma factor [Planctomycetes bacterium]|nr:sigma-70 family RNA polymerase sigma factor [Planctomycetota bacterium]